MIDDPIRNASQYGFISLISSADLIPLSVIIVFPDGRIVSESSRVVDLFTNRARHGADWIAPNPIT